MQQSKEVKITISEILYICFFCLMLFAKGLGLYDGQILYKLFFLAGMGLVALKMCITGHTVKEWGIIGILGLLAVLVYLNSREKGILVVFSTILSMKGVSKERIFRVGMLVWGITMSGNVLYHLLNLDSSGYKVHEKLGLGHIFRWDLGFSHPNVLHISYLMLCGFIIYNLDRKYNWKHAVGLMLGNLFIFLYSVSYTGIMAVTLYLGISWYINIRENLNKLEYILLELVFPVCVLLSLLSPILLPEKIFNIANKIFSNRLILSEYYLVPEKMTLFGSNLENITTHVLTMDNAYVFSLVIYGMVFFSIMVVSYLLLNHWCAKEKRKKDLALISCFMIAGITEPFLFNTSFKNLTLLLLGDFLFGVLRHNGEEQKEWAIFIEGNKELCFRELKLTQFIDKIVLVWEREKKRILLIAIGCGLGAGIIYGANREMPKGYIMPRIHVDIVSDETWYLQNADEPQYKDMKILDYRDSETRMQIFDGNIIVVEYIRECVTVFCIMTLVTGTICMVGYMLNFYKKNQKES